MSHQESVKTSSTALVTIIVIIRKLFSKHFAAQNVFGDLLRTVSTLLVVIFDVKSTCAKKVKNFRI